MKAFIFDMDGTLVDNMSFHDISWQRLLDRLGKKMSLEEVRKVAYGKNEEVMERVFQKKHTLDELSNFFRIKESIYRELYTPHLKPIKGLIQFLEKSETLGVPMAIGTGAGVRNLNFVLDGLNIRRFFKALVTADQVEYGKPHPETFLKAASILKMRPGECIVFEDVPSGAEAARQAGMQSILLTTTYPRSFLAALPSVIEIVDDYSLLIPQEILKKI